MYLKNLQNNTAKLLAKRGPAASPFLTMWVDNADLMNKF